MNFFFIIIVVIGIPAGERTMGEGEVGNTNWTRLADEWFQAKERIATRMNIPLLPNKSSTHEFNVLEVVVNGTETEHLTRVIPLFQSGFNVYL